MKHKGIWVAAVLIVILLAGFGFNTYDSFHHNGLDQALVGQVEEDRYPDWGKWDSSTKVSGLECDIISKSGLFVSDIYLIERANHYQVRLRIGCSMPFVHPELLQETWWVLEDSAGNSYTENMVAYSEQIAGLNCMNVTLVLDGEEFSNLAGKELDFSAICSEQRGDTPDVEASYAHCDIRIAFP
jgi:hypothetical protein|nr:hypothetical protein [uncultured Acetatifactor sp.]